MKIEEFVPGELFKTGGYLYRFTHYEDCHGYYRIYYDQIGKEEGKMKEYRDYIANNNMMEEAAPYIRKLNYEIY